MTRSALGWLALLAVLLVSTHAFLASRLGVDDDDLIIYFTWIEVPVYLAAAFVVVRDKGADPRATRRATTAILVVALILRAMIVPIDPVSTDINRYVWDGRVQAAGINPYVYIPADPALKDLRDDDIYPEINRKEYAPTIYPPFAQIVFFIVTRFSETLIAMKAAMTVFDVVAMWALLMLLKRRRLPATRVLLYAWHPLPIWQFSGDGHVDAIGVCCLCLALLAADAGKPVLAGIALGGATLTKFFPVLIGPAIYRRWGWKLPLAGFLTLVALYLPYLGAGTHLFGFLAGYSAEEGYKDGSGIYVWILLQQLLPGLPQGAFRLYAPATALILSVLGLTLLFRPRPSEVDIGGALLIVMVFTLLSSPHYHWYLTILVPFLCFVLSWPVLWLTTVATAMTRLAWPPDFIGGSILYLAPVGLAVVQYAVRRIRVRSQIKECREGSSP